MSESKQKGECMLLAYDNDGLLILGSRFEYESRKSPGV